MNCKRCQALLSAYLDKELKKCEAGSVAEHLSQCRECEQVLKKMSGVQAQYAKLMTPSRQEEHLAERILASLPERRSASGLPHFSRRMTGLMLGVLLAAVLLLLGQTWYPFFRLLGRLLAQFGYVALLFVAKEPLLHWLTAMGTAIALLLLYRLLRAQPKHKKGEKA